MIRVFVVARGVLYGLHGDIPHTSAVLPLYHDAVSMIWGFVAAQR